MIETKYDKEWLKKEFGSYVGIKEIAVTPDIAIRWLNCNTHNRPLNEKRVKKYQKDMELGYWAPSNVCIAWDDNGILMDGQKRLWALANLKEIQPDLKITLPIKWGISRNPSKGVFTMDYIDRQQQRSASQNWGLRLRRPSCTFKPSDIGKVSNVFAKVFSGGERQTVEAPEIDFIYKCYKSEFDLVLSQRQSSKRLSTAPVLAAMIFAAKIEPDKVSKFQEGLYGWLNFKPGSPILCLAKRLVDSPRADQLTRIPAFKETLTAIRYFVAEESLFKIYTSDKGLDYFLNGQEDIVGRIRTRIKFNQNGHEIGQTS